MADGIVDPNSVRWVLGNGQDPEIGPSTVKLEFKIKSFNLDDIDLPDGYFVTGDRFVLLEDNHVSLGVRGTQMWAMSESKPSISRHLNKIMISENKYMSRITKILLRLPLKMSK
ncbi:GSCOCG00005424001-RA-CDS [Cotesia congregata]|nr:GSCOCG00005424001-RA-CDS [Cotesia congregata]